MAKYRVNILDRRVFVYEEEAETKEEAQTLAEERYLNGLGDDADDELKDSYKMMEDLVKEVG